MAFVTQFCIVVSTMNLFCISSAPAKKPNITETIELNPPDLRELTNEDKYVQYFENDPSWYHGWRYMAKLIRDQGDTPLKHLCEEAHFRAGFGLAIIHAASMNASTLLFKNENYSPMKIDVITYDIKDYGFYSDKDEEKKNRYYITEGARSDCVFYLKPASANKTEYYLDEHVCGLIIH